jgi:hypothetical protein
MGLIVGNRRAIIGLLAVLLALSACSTASRGTRVSGQPPIRPDSTQSAANLAGFPTVRPTANRPISPPPEPSAITVLSRLKAAGLPIGRVVAMTADDWRSGISPWPDRSTSSASFQDTRLPPYPHGDPNGGTVIVFATTTDLHAYQMLREMQEQEMQTRTRSRSTYFYAANLTLLILTASLTPEQVSQYETILPLVSGDAPLATPALTPIPPRTPTPASSPRQTSPTSAP